MTITLIHQHVPSDACADERDVLEQVAAVQSVLCAQGHRVSTLDCTTDLGNLMRKVALLQPACLFNLVETLAGSGRLIHLAPVLWEVAGIPFTGSSAEALYLTTNKLLAKEKMLSAGLPVPVWVTDDAATHGVTKASAVAWIVKSVWEHASIGLNDASIHSPKSAKEIGTQIPQGFFAEQFIDGRECNVALLAGPEGPEILPIAEIVFEDYPLGKPRIVGYQAKWEGDSFEYTHTVRRFLDADAEQPLTITLQRLARQCWELFNLSGYARVDFRIDSTGKPWILEVNANPCIAPDSGFAAMLTQAGITYDEAIARILNDALPIQSPLPSSPAESCFTTGSTHRPIKLPHPVTYRKELLPSDIHAIREVTRATGYFHEHEISVAVELVEERLAKGATSGYEFVVAEYEGAVVGYTSFGPIPCTVSSFDWYWLAVTPEMQGYGIGAHLLREVLAEAAAMGGQHLYCETSSRAQYAPTRAFYERMGFKLCEVLPDFYAPEDGRATYCKELTRQQASV